MPSLIACPHCGPRPKEEYTIKGAAIQRPAGDADPAIWFDYVYLRDNPYGAYDEYWHHTSGCRRWIVVSRNTVTHDIDATCDASLYRRTGTAK